MKLLVITPQASYDSFGESDVLNEFVDGIKVYDASSPEKLAISWSKALKSLKILESAIEEGLGIVTGRPPKMPQISLKDASNSEKVAKLTEKYESELAEYNRLDDEENVVTEILESIQETPIEKLNDSFDIRSKIGKLTLEEYIKYMEKIADNQIYDDSLNFYSYTELE